MNADKLWLLWDFIGVNKVVFKIPVYQRNYDWKLENCERLLDDIGNIINEGKKHFLGAIVFMALNDAGMSMREFVIIDGQQRLTTMIILLKALADCSKDIDEECYDEIDSSFLHNKHCAEEFKVKLKPVKSDNEQFMYLMKDEFDNLDSEGHICQNYNYCKERITNWLNSGIKPYDILTALQKLEIVQIVLTKGEDDPQEIFESLNSTGLDLTPADLIRNFILMNADNQDELYEKYWINIEKTLKQGNDYDNLNSFFTQYLVFKTGNYVKSKDLYSFFVKMYNKQNYTQENILKELKYYSEIYKTFIFESDKYSKAVNHYLKCLRELNQTTCYPFLFHVFDDYLNGTIDENTVEKILKLIVSYIVRRSVCGVGSNSLRGLFTYLYNRAFKVKTNKNKYYETINKLLFSLTGKDAYPSDNDFLRNLKTISLYKNSTLCKFILVDIENGMGKEVVNVDTLTIEHIMPQKLNADWSYIGEEDHEQYLHTLGNLSVTGYNSELSNNSFATKKKIFNESKAVILNADVVDKDIWNIDTIINRSERLSNIVLKHYCVEEIIDNSITFESSSKVTLYEPERVVSKKLVSYCFEGKTYQQKIYACMLLDMFKLLDKKNPRKLEQLAASNYSINIKYTKHPHITTNKEILRWPWEVRDGIYFEGNIGSKTIMNFIKRLLEEYNIDVDSFYVNIMENEKEDEESSEE